MRFASTAFIGSQAGAGNIIQEGLAFDFRAQDYQSGSLNWNAYVGNYTASVTGTMSGGLEYFDGSKVGFDGNRWLTFNSSMTASISSSQWNIYVLTEFTNQQLDTSSFKPAFFSKGAGAYPEWNWWYRGGGNINQKGDVFVNGWVDISIYNEGGRFEDSFNNVFGTFGKQLFGYQIIGGPTGSLTTAFVTANAGIDIPGNSIVGNPANYGLNSFTGSAVEPLLFGKIISNAYPYPESTNMTGSVVRIFGYNRNLTQAERKSNWLALSNSYT